MKHFSEKGEMSYMVLFFIATIATFLVGGGNVLNSQYNIFGHLVLGKTANSNTTEQLNTLSFITVTPSPTDVPSASSSATPSVSPTSGGPTPTTGVTNPTPTTGPSGTKISLLCGANLGLFDDNDWINNTGAQTSLAKLNVSTIRTPWRATGVDPTGSRMVRSVQIAHSLGIVPLVILPSETTFANQDIQIVTQLNAVMGGSQIFYELGNEVFDSAYLGKWNTIIPQLKPIAVNAWFGGPVALSNFGGQTTNMAQFYVSANPKPDFLDWHEYSCGHTDNAQYCFDHIANTQGTAAGHNWTQHMQDTQAALQKLGVPTMPKVFITEWNYDSVDPGPNDGRLATLNGWHFTQVALNELKSIGVYAAYHYSLNTGQAYPLESYNGSTFTAQGQDFQNTCAGL